MWQDYPQAEWNLRIPVDEPGSRAWPRGRLSGERSVGSRRRGCASSPRRCSPPSEKVEGTGGEDRALAEDSTGPRKHPQGELFSFHFGRSPSDHHFRRPHVVNQRCGEGRGLVRGRALTALYVADGPMLRTLLDRVEAALSPVLGDAADAGRRSVTDVAERDGEIYVPPKFWWTARSRGHPARRRMPLRYRPDSDLFQRAHRFRANVKEAFSARKRHQESFLRGRSPVMQRRGAGSPTIARKVELLARARAVREVF